MSAEVKMVQEDLKREDEMQAHEGLTLEELGLTIPHKFNVKGWDASTRINKLYEGPQGEFSKTFKSLFADVIEHGFFDFALEIIKTADRPDKLGFDPNFPVVVHHPSKYRDYNTPTPFSPLSWVFAKHKDEQYDGLVQIVDALISRNALLNFEEFKEYYKSKGIQTEACAHSEETPLNIITKGYITNFMYYRGPNDDAEIDRILKTTPMKRRIIAEYWMQLEPMMEDDITVNTVDKFKDKINQSMPTGVKVELPEPIFGIIYSYLSKPVWDFGDRLGNVRNAIEKYYLPFRKEKDDEFKTKIERIKAEEKAKAETQAGSEKKTGAERKPGTEVERVSAVSLGPTVDFELMVVRQNEIITQQNALMLQQNEMIRKLQDINQSQAQQISQLMRMYQGFKSVPAGTPLVRDVRDTRDTRDGMASVLFSLPASESIKDHFEISEPKPHKQ